MKAKERSASGGKRRGAKEEPVVESPDLDLAEQAYNAIAEDLAALDTALLTPARVDVQRAALVALGVVQWAKQAEPSERFQDAAKCKSLRFSSKAVGRLESVVLASFYVRHQVSLRENVSSAKLPEALDEASSKLRERMFKCAEYNLDDNADAMVVLEAIRSGNGYLDRANDLIALANVYKTYKKVLSNDTRRYRSEDQKAARETGMSILHALGQGASAEGVDWQMQLQRVWHLLRRAYAEVESVGRCLYRNEGADALFPNLVAGARERGKTGSSGEPDPAPPAPAPNG